MACVCAAWVTATHLLKHTFHDADAAAAAAAAAADAAADDDDDGGGGGGGRHVTGMLFSSSRNGQVSLDHSRCCLQL